MLVLMSSITGACNNIVGASDSGSEVVFPVETFTSCVGGGVSTKLNGIAAIIAAAKPDQGNSISACSGLDVEGLNTRNVHRNCGSIHRWLYYGEIFFFDRIKF